MAKKTNNQRESLGRNVTQESLGECKQISVTMPRMLIEDLDKAASSDRRTRSFFLSELVRKHVPRSK